jgi:hypothetical protein
MAMAQAIVLLPVPFGPIIMLRAGPGRNSTLSYDDDDDEGDQVKQQLVRDTDGCDILHLPASIPDQLWLRRKQSYSCRSRSDQLSC